MVGSPLCMFAVLHVFVQVEKLVASLHQRSKSWKHMLLTPVGIAGLLGLLWLVPGVCQQVFQRP